MKVTHLEVFQFQLDLEYWSVGVMAIGLVSFFNTPILHHSIIPEPALLRNFGNLIITFLLVIALKN